METGSGPSGRGRRAAVRVLLVLGGVLTALGLIAGHLNRQLLDGPTFADHVDAIRRDEDVATALGLEISRQVVASRPDLIALRPLVDSVAIQVAGGDLLSGPTRLAAEAAHRALTDDDADSFVLRLSDVGAVVTGVLGVVAPEQAPAAADVSVALASIGDQAFATATIEIARVLGILAWLLPVGALACFVGAVGVSRQRWRTATSVGWTLLGAAGGVAVLLVLGGWLVRRFDDERVGGAVVRAGWSEVFRPMWWAAAVLAVVGAAVVVSCGPTSPDLLTRDAARVRGVLLRRPTRPVWVVLRAVAAVALGMAAIIDPLGLIEPLVVLGGAGLVLYGISTVAGLASAAHAADAGEPSADHAERRAHGRGRTLGLVAAGVVVVGGVVLLARPGRDLEAVDAAGAGEVCNGHAELCARRFDEVAYVGSHNAMSVASEPGWFLAEQADPIPVQLDQGVRALLVDVWSGRPAGTVVRTAEGSYEEARAVAEAELGPEVVAAAQRLADSVAGVAEGPEARYLCHGLCETGSAPFLGTLGQIRTWLASHPDEVVTLFIEDHVDAALVAADVEAAGLLPYVHEQAVGVAWPTLGEMIRSGGRLVVMVEEGVGGADAPWLLNGFEHTQDTPYTFPTVESFTCDPNRGPDDAPHLLLNHWLSGFDSVVTDAQLVNARDVLLPRAEQCRDERGQIPNFVAVNFVTIGDVFAVVDELNGVA